jgi:hypothetical protein
MNPIRQSAVLALLVLASCAPPSVTPPADLATSGTPIPQLHQTAHGMDASYQNEATIATEDLPVSADSAWAALPRAYQALGIEVKFMDPASHTVGNLQFHPHGGIHGKRVSEYFDCGTAVSGAPIADVYAVRISVRTQVSANGSASRAHTLLEATARSMDGTSNSAVPCTSRGTLEPAINAAVLMHLT